MKTDVIAVISARYGSTRFPGKALALLKGKPMVEWVWRKVTSAKKINRVIVATDDRRIADVIERAGGEAKMTSKDHPSGTDRTAEAVRGLEAAWILNVQGDEPMIEGWALDEFVEKLGQTEMATLARKIEETGAENDPNVVKVVTDAQGCALYFSRAAIPFRRDAGAAAVDYWHHLGIYAYRPATLQKFVSLPPSRLEQIEKLEQLRALENGIEIQVIRTTLKVIGVDTPEDLKRVEQLI
ncbi:MAG: 3-deoxy-manno-octulosonate cytidylyltransferase [bacterium]